MSQVGKKVSGHPSFWHNGPHFMAILPVAFEALQSGRPALSSPDASA